MADKHKNKHDGHKGKGGGKGGKNPATVKSLIREALGSKTVQPLSGKGLKKFIRAGSRLRYGPLENELDKQLRAEQATQQRNKAYYNDYLSRVRNIQQNTGDIYSRANDQLATAQQQASVGDSNLLQILNQNRQKQAETMGAAPSDAVNPLAQAQVARSSAALGNQQRIIGQGATQQSYLADQRRIGSRQKIETLQEGLDRIRSVRQDQEDMAREKGAFKTDMLRDLREGERGFLIDLLSGPNARKLAHIQMSGSKSSGGSSSSGSSEKANKGKNKNEQRRNAHDAMTELRSMSSKDKKKYGTDVGEMTRYLIQQGYDASLARRIAKRFARKRGGGGHKGGGHKGGGGKYHGGKGGPGMHIGP